LKKPPIRQRRHDWAALKAEWLTSKETLNTFRIRHKITSRNWFYAQVEAKGWVEDKLAIEKKALAKLGDAQADLLAQDWTRQLKLWRAVENQAAAILRRFTEEDGTPRGMDAQELTQLASALEKALKCQKLIKGEPTGDQPIMQNFHLAVVALLEAKRRNDPSVINVDAAPDAAP
jgi:hypothetical protein